MSAMVQRRDDLPTPNDWTTMRPEDVYRFHSYVEQSGSCWLWTGGKDQRGYGQFSLRGKNWRAHRVSWFMSGRALSKGAFLCHRCDNPSCVRPDHLFAGTALDNSRDMVSKGRSASGDRHPLFIRPELRAVGERNGKAKLTEKAVIAIRASYVAGESKMSLARKFDVSHTTIRQVITGRTWRTVNG